MNFSLFDTTQSADVIALFNRVFTDSEGKDEGKLIGDLVAEIINTDPQDLVGFVAKDNDNIVASIFFSRVTFAVSTSVFILSPVAVATECQGKGIGQQLITFGFDQLKQQGVELALTYGDPNFYSKVGFIPVTEDVIKAPLTLSYPEGWLAHSLTGENIQPIPGDSRCVDALNHQVYW